MIKSMTGYGKATSRGHGMMIDVELNAVNSRFLEIFIRSPKELLFYDRVVRESISKYLKRGKVDVYVNVSQDPSSKNANFGFDDGLLAVQLNALRRIKKKFSINGDVTIGDMLTHREMFGLKRREIDIKRACPLIQKVLQKALARVIQMRTREGRHLYNDITRHYRDAAGNVEKMAKRRKSLAPVIEKRLHAKIKKYFDGIKIDSKRIYAEAAVLIEKSDISEEIARMKSHGNQMKTFLRKHEPVGRSLDFLMQEMHREINTIGSKANDNVMTRYVVDVKASLEKIREQVQNVE